MAKHDKHDEKHLVARSWRIFIGVLVLVIVGGFAVHMHPHFAIEKTPLFFVWFGFISCAILVVITKLLSLLLKQPEDYYGEDK